jgi:hypothetical protein
MLFAIGCGADDKFKSEVVHNRDFIKQSKYCKKVDLYNSPLNKENTINVFKCFNWDRAHPNLLNYIQKSKTAEWNHLMAPFNKAFFGNEQSRLKFLEAVAALKEDGGFSNLNDFVKVFFKNSNAIDLALSLTNKNHPYRYKLVELSHDRAIGLEEVRPGLKAYQELTRSIFVNRDDLTQNIEALNDNNAYFKNLIPLSDSISKFLLSDKVSTYSYAIKNLASYSDIPWMYKLIFNGLTENDFVDTFFFAREHYKETVKDFEIFNESIDKNITCSGSNDEYRFLIDSKTEIYNKVDKLMLFDELSFWQEMLDARAKIITFNNFCIPSIDGVEHKELLTVFNRIHKRSEQFLKMPLNFQSMGHIHNVLSNDQSESKLNLVRILGSSFTKKIIKLTNYIYEKDKTFANTLFKVIKELNISFYLDLDKFNEEIVSDENIRLLNYFGQSWDGLNQQEKLTVLKLLEYQFDKRFNFNKITKYFSSFLDINKSIDSIIYDNYFPTKDATAKTFDLINKELQRAKDAEVLDEIASFLSKDGLLRLFELFSQGIQYTIDNGVERDDNPIISSPVDSNIVLKKSIQKCLNDIEETLPAGMDFYAVLYNLPKSCEGQFSGKLVFDVVRDLKGINAKFAALYGQNLVAAQALLSPQMMQDVFSSIVGMQVYFSKTGLIQESLDEIVGPLNKYFFDKQNIRMVDDFIGLIELSNSKFEKVTNKLILDSAKLLFEDKRDTYYLFSTLESASKVEIKSNGHDCNAIIGNLNAHKCPTKNIVKEKFEKVLSLVSDKTDSDDQLSDSIINLFRKDIGISIPVRRKLKKQRLYSLSLMNLARMFTVLSVAKPYNITYETENESYTTNSTVLVRIENVIKDIGFLENFYGAFFMNTVAHAKKYTKKVKQLKSNVKLLQNTGGVLRKINVFPKQTKWLMNNIMQTYDGLTEAGEMGFEDELQAALALVSMTSPKKNQSFQPYRIPKVEKVAGHKGQLLTYLTQVRGLSHLGELFKASYLKNGKFTPDEKLSVISDNFLMMFSPNLLKSEINKLMQDKAKVLELSNSLIDSLYGFSEQTRAEFSALAWDMTYVFHKVYGDNEADFIIRKTSQLTDLAINLNKKLNLPKEEVARLINLLARVMRGAALNVKDLEYRNSIKKSLTKLIENIDIIGIGLKFLNDDQIVKKVEELLSTFVDASLDVENSDKIWESLKQYFSSKYFNNDSLLKWIKENSLAADNIYLSNLINFLSKKENNSKHSNLSKVLIELIEKDPERLSKFLREINESVTFESR